jgi:hypothetical protein
MREDDSHVFGHGSRRCGAGLLAREGVSRGRPARLDDRPDQSDGRPLSPDGHPSGLEGHPGRLEHRPGEPDGRPTGSESRPDEPEGGGAARRGSVAARRDGMAAPRRGMAARRRPGAAPGRPLAAPRSPAAARRRGLDGARTGLDGPRRPSIFVPEGRRDVATGGAKGRRPERNPWTGADNTLSAPAGRRTPTGFAGASSYTPFLRPCRGGVDLNDAFQGLRSLADSLTPPVATALDPSGVAGEVPEGRHAPLASADQHGQGAEVCRG